MQRVVIVGAGAMGCLFAARLAEAGIDVTLVEVDAQRLGVLQRDGVLLVDDNGERNIAVRAASADEVHGPADLIIIFTKSMHTSAAAHSVAHLANGSVYALTLQNGIGNADVLAAVFGPDRVLIGITDFPADLEGPAKVKSHGRGHVQLGGHNSESQNAAAAAAVLLNRGDLNAQAVEDVEIAIWEKLTFNAALNALSTVTGLPGGGLDREPGHRIIGSVVEEVVEVAAAKGILLDRPGIEARIAFALAHHRDHKASMLQDRLAGRPTEIESTNGAIARLAQALGLIVPVTSTLADLVRLTDAHHESLPRP